MSAHPVTQFGSHSWCTFVEAEGPREKVAKPQGSPRAREAILTRSKHGQQTLLPWYWLWTRSSPVSPWTQLQPTCTCGFAFSHFCQGCQQEPCPSVPKIKGLPISNPTWVPEADPWSSSSPALPGGSPATRGLPSDQAKAMPADAPTTGLLNELRPNCALWGHPMIQL